MFRFYLCAPLAALLVGIPAWFHFVVASGHPTNKRGALVGMVVSITAHPVMWLLFYIPSLTPQAGNSALMILLMAVLGLIYGGWATTAMGALMGGLLVALQRALMRSADRHAYRFVEPRQWQEKVEIEVHQANAEGENGVVKSKPLFDKSSI